MICLATTTTRGSEDVGRLIAQKNRIIKPKLGFAAVQTWPWETVVVRIFLVDAAGLLILLLDPWHVYMYGKLVARESVGGTWYFSQYTFVTLESIDVLSQNEDFERIKMCVSTAALPFKEVRQMWNVAVLSDRVRDAYLIKQINNRGPDRQTYSEMRLFYVCISFAYKRWRSYSNRGSPLAMTHWLPGHALSGHNYQSIVPLLFQSPVVYRENGSEDCHGNMSDRVRKIGGKCI